MPQREVLKRIILARGQVQKGKDKDGNPIYEPKERHDLKVGTVFDFTESELDDLPPGTVTNETTVNLDDDSSVLRQDTQLESNQTSAPDASGEAL